MCLMYLHIVATKHKYYSRKIFFWPGKTHNRILKLSYLCNDLHPLVFDKDIPLSGIIPHRNFINENYIMFKQYQRYFVLPEERHLEFHVMHNSMALSFNHNARRTGDFEIFPVFFPHNSKYYLRYLISFRFHSSIQDR